MRIDHRLQLREQPAQRAGREGLGVAAQRGLQAAEIEAIVAGAGVAPLVMQDRLFDSLGTMPSPVPVLAVVGRREAEEGSLVLRRLPGREQVTLPLAEAVALLAREATPPDLRQADCDAEAAVA